MTFTEAMTDLELRLSAFQIKDKLGDVLPGNMCFGLLEKVTNGGWGELLDEWERGLTVDQFHAKGLLLMDELRKFRFRNAIEKKILELKN